MTYICLFMTITQWLLLKFQVIRGLILRKVSRENFFFFTQNFLKQLRNNDELETAISNYLPFRLESLAEIAISRSKDHIFIAHYVHSVFNRVGNIIGADKYVLNKNGTVFSIKFCFIFLFPRHLWASASILTLVFSLPKNFSVSAINYT